MPILGGFWPRWKRRWIHFASSNNQKKENNQFKTKKQPKLPENPTAWKSNNQRVKEETFIQTGRRGRDRQPEQKRTRGKAVAGGPAVPHSHADKPGRITGEQDRPHNPGFQCRQNKHSKPLAVKYCGG